MHRDDIGVGKDFFQGDAAYVEQVGVFLAEIGIVDGYIAAKGLEQTDDAAAHHTSADEPHFFGVK